jgi:hypothetical protein
MCKISPVFVLAKKPKGFDMSVKVQQEFQIISPKLTNYLIADF